MSSSAIDLNNEGVLHLDAGEYEKAAYAFKEASKLVLMVVAKELPLALAAAEAEAQRSSSQSKPLASVNNKSQEQYQDSVQEKKRKVPNPTSSPVVSRPRKRQRKSSSTSMSTEVCNVSGRPLWMKKPAPGKKGFRATTEAAIILYNLGLTFQLNGSRIVEKTKSRQWMYKRSLDLYSMAKELILGSPATHAFESPVFLVALHNMANVFQELGDGRRVASTRKEIAAVLRLLRASNLVGIVNDRGYEGFYLKLLSLPPSNKLAAAA